MKRNELITSQILTEWVDSIIIFLFRKPHAGRGRANEATQVSIACRISRCHLNADVHCSRLTKKALFKIFHSHRLRFDHVLKLLCFAQRTDHSRGASVTVLIVRSTCKRTFLANWTLRLEWRLCTAVIRGRGMFFRNINSYDKTELTQPAAWLCIGR